MRAVGPAVVKCLIRINNVLLFYVHNLPT